jgi:hypothetical protein
MKQWIKIGKSFADVVVKNPLGLAVVLLAGGMIFAMYVVLRVVLHVIK